jgi:hypothetical protein
MTENGKPHDRRIRMGDQGNYNESIGRDYIQGNFYQINISQDENSQTSSKKSESQHHSVLDNQQNIAVNSSGKWVMIKGYFFESTKIRTHQDNKITVEICSNSAEEDANIRSLRPERYGHSDIISFAYRNDGFLVRVESIEEEFEDDVCTWSLTLIPENTQYGGDTTECAYHGHDRYYSVDDIAELRGRRILLNNPPKPDRKRNYYLSDSSMIESFISSPINRNIKVDSCVLKELYPYFIDQPRKYLEVSRLAAIFYLKAANVVEQILELSLELIEQDKVHVKFKGKRRRTSINVEPAIIQIEGDCYLSQN